ncbi:MAG: lysylphosphatidylglycerol synthase transmembrane domain-containing protein [Candidatus Thermoplasmatota archaeon]|nr:lysylphosphatidylglycerol synthase transmembrane domain-containing protein [Candidatus Thermoplasmatota archaeon]
MRKHLNWKDALYIGLALVLIFGLVQRADPEQVLRSIRGVDLSVIAAVLCLWAINTASKTTRWMLILSGVGARRPGAIAVPIFLSSLGLNNSTPGKIGGEPVRAYMLKTHTGTRLSVGIASIFAEKALDILTILILAIIGSIYLMHRIGLADFRVIMILVVVGGAVIALTISMITSRGFAGWAFRSISRIIPSSGSGKRLKGFIGGFESSVGNFHISLRMLFRNRATLIHVLVLDVVIWLNEAARLYLVVLALPGDADIGLMGAIAAASIANILGFILPVGSGNLLGSASVVETLTGDPKLGASASLVAVITSLWLTIPLGLISLAVLRRFETIRKRSINVESGR